MRTDVAEEDEVRSLVEKTTDPYHRLDFAFNNAGIEQAMNQLVQQRLKSTIAS